MQITQAEYKNGTLILTTKDPEARKLPYKFKSGNYKIVKSQGKRTNDANAYCWMLCTKISEVLKIPKEEVYRNSIKEGNEYTAFPIRGDALDEFMRIWSGRGIGWFAEAVDDSKIPGYKLVFAYHGSSVYNKKQMASLIDRLVQDAKSLDIETLTERELSLIKEAWNEKTD